jgi:hypothetical protein
MSKLPKKVLTLALLFAAMLISLGFVFSQQEKKAPDDSVRKLDMLAQLSNEYRYRNKDGSLEIWVHGGVKSGVLARPVILIRSKDKDQDMIFVADKGKAAATENGYSLWLEQVYVYKNGASVFKESHMIQVAP